MSPLWTYREAARATGGIAHGEWQAQRIEIDSRKIQAGDVFLALKGERLDAHAFLAEAKNKGAVAAIVSEIPSDAPADFPLLVVADTFKALEALAIFARTRSQAKIIGVTGSVGKTSTREMIRIALSAHGATYATSGNYNNHIGVPLTLANMPLHTRFAVIEMGMNHAGEIAPLSRLARPHIAVITTVEAVHLEFFESVEGIAREKSEIIQGLLPGGVLLLNYDNEWFDVLVALAVQKKPKVQGCGASNGADYQLLSYEPTQMGGHLQARIGNANYDYQLAAVGRHFALNSLFALAAVAELGLDVAPSAQALADFSEVEGRGKVIALGNGAFLVDDSYNASPASMKAAFAKVALMPGTGRKMAALGDMLELGHQAKLLHRKLADSLIEAGFSEVFTAGNLMKTLHEALPVPLRAGHVVKAEDLFSLVEKKLQPGDILLVKGSHGSHIYKLSQYVKEKFGAI